MSALWVRRCCAQDYGYPSSRSTGLIILPRLSARCARACRPLWKALRSRSFREGEIMAIVVNDRERIGEEKLSACYGLTAARSAAAAHNVALGLKDTFYDYGRWLYILSTLGRGHRNAAQRDGHVPLQVVCKLPRRAAHARSRSSLWGFAMSRCASSIPLWTSSSGRRHDYRQQHPRRPPHRKRR